MNALETCRSSMLYHTVHPVELSSEQRDGYGLCHFCLRNYVLTNGQWTSCAPCTCTCPEISKSNVNQRPITLKHKYISWLPFILPPLFQNVLVPSGMLSIQPITLSRVLCATVTGFYAPPSLLPSPSVCVCVVSLSSPMPVHSHGFASLCLYLIRLCQPSRQLMESVYKCVCV